MGDSGVEDERGVAVTTGAGGEDCSRPVSIVGSIDGSDSSSSSSSSESSERDSLREESQLRKKRGLCSTHVVRFCYIVYASLERTEERLVNVVLIVLVALTVSSTIELEVVDCLPLGIAVCHGKVLVG